MSRVVIAEVEVYGDIDHAIRRLKHLLGKARVFQKLRDKRYYLKPSDAKRLKQSRAEKRNRLKSKKEKYTDKR